MANALVVCLISVALFYCTGLSSARQLPKECAKGPSYWCQNLKIASDCGAVGHCTTTVWEKQTVAATSNQNSLNFIHLFAQLKDVKDLINEDYLSTRISSACKDASPAAVARICKENTAQLEKYIFHVLQSEASAETMCQIVGMCNNLKVDNFFAQDNKTTEHSKRKNHLVGNRQCTWGPSYWCSNFSTSRECKATPHCVQRIWPKMDFPHDDDSICKICTDMVQQARDQLQSNETQEELKEVFEGSCKLIPIKIVAKECMKLADDFVPELVETLASEMNPQTVCSVAGLCNNAKIDNLLEGYNDQLKLRESCNNCQRTVSVMRKNFDATSDEDFLVGLLKMCRNMDSFSDSCSMLVFKYYENIVQALKKDLTGQSVCHLSSQCTYRFHTHNEYNFPEAPAATDDNVPCELCEQLVQHLRDVMVANTTELEFYKVMKGLCKQTGNFKDECLHLAEQYYPIVYQYLVNDLKPAELCSMIGICTKNVTDVPIAPLVSREIVVTGIKKFFGGDEAKSNTSEKVVHVSTANSESNVRVMTEQPLPLPIERMFVSVTKENKVACSFCTYFLHYLQVTLSDGNTEDKITDAVNKACDKLPKSVNGECREFVTQYGPAVIALLVQEIDPSTICPALRICPQTEVPLTSTNIEKANCPLCLFAVEQLESVLKNNHSEENIRQALDKLCSHLSDSLRAQCVDFVDTYTQQLIETILADMDAQEICVFLKLCSDNVHDPLKITHAGIDKFHDKPMLRGDRNNFRGRSMLPQHMLERPHQLDGDIETNEIPDNTVNGRPVKSQGPKTICVVCQFVLKEIDDEIKDKHNEDEIKKVVHGICKHMPKSVKGECDQFVDKYADLIISLLAQELDPSEVCEELKLCDAAAIAVVKEEILDCAVCETVVMAVKKVITNERVDHDIVHVVEKSCGMLPAKYSARCHTMMEIYGDSVIHMIEQWGVKGVCQRIGLCSGSRADYVRMYRDHRN